MQVSLPYSKHPLDIYIYANEKQSNVNLLYKTIQFIRIIMFLKWIKYALHEEDAE